MTDIAARAADAVARRNEAEAQSQGQAAAPNLQQQITAPWMREEIQKQLGPGYDAGVFIRSVVTSIKQSPDLALCDPATVFGGMFTAAQLQLEIGSGLGQAYLIPRKNRGDWEASFQLGYPGLLALSYRSGVLEGANTELVMVGDRFKRGSSSERGPFYDLDYGPEHENPDTQVMGVLGFFWTKGSSRPVWRYLTIEEVEDRRPEYTRRPSHKGPWVTNYRSMVEKTALINVLKYAPKNARMAQAMAADDAVLTARREAPNEITAKHDDHDRESVLHLDAETSAPPQDA